MIKQLTHGAQESIVTRRPLAFLPGLFRESDLEDHIEKHDLNISVGQSRSLIIRAGKLASRLSGFLFADTSSSPEIFFISHQYNGHLAFSFRLSDLLDEFDHLPRHLKAVMIVNRVHHNKSLAIPYIRSFGLCNREKKKNFQTAPE